MRQYEMAELTFRGDILQDNWAQIDLWADIACGEESVRVRGFYAGEGEYRVRFLPWAQGEYRYRVTGVIEAEGYVPVEAAREGCRGIVKTRGTEFIHQDGTPFHPFGTTVYALAHQEKERIDQTIETLSKAPFNKVRMCMFPKDYRYNHNEPDHYAFLKGEDGKWDVTRPNFAYWEAMEYRLGQLQELGIQADLILFHPYDRWGFAELTREERFTYLSYLLARLSALPHVWWSLANEYDLMHISLSEWEEIEDYVAEHDPFGHPLSNHNCIHLWDFARKNVTHACIQCKELCRVSEWKRQYEKPVVIDECCYEGNLPDEWGCISGREMTNRFWRAATVGGYCTHGETFLDDEEEVLWWAKGGVLHGESPARIAFLREIIESLPGQLQAVETYWESMRIVPEGKRAETLDNAGGMRLFIESLWRMNEVDQRSFTAWGQQYEGRIGDEVMLRFYDNRTSARDFLKLNAEALYRVEVIDTWNMTREVLGEAMPGNAMISLPGREGIAVLALKVG